MCFFTEVLLFQKVLTAVYPQFDIKNFQLSNSCSVNIKKNAQIATIWQGHSSRASVLDHPVYYLNEKVKLITKTYVYELINGGHKGHLITVGWDGQQRGPEADGQVVGIHHVFITVLCHTGGEGGWSIIRFFSMEN